MLDLRITRDTGPPICRQIADAVRDAVVAGQLAPGEKLPSKVTLARSLGISPITVGRGYDLLCHWGMVMRKRGSGTYVRPDAGQRSTALSDVEFDRLVIVIGAPDPAAVPRWDAPILWELCLGIEDVLGRRSGRIDYATSLDRACVESLTEDSAVLLKQGRDVQPAVLEELARRRIPVLGIWGHPGPNDTVPRVHYDYQQAVRLAVTHLIKCGYRRLGFIGDMGGGISLGYKFFEFTNALYHANLDFEVRHVSQVRDEPGLAYEAAMKIAADDTPDAFFIDTDWKAMEAIAALRRAGLRVPEDIGVVGYDDIPEAARFDPPLTTVRTPRREIGRTAARLLCDRVAHGVPPETVVLPPELMVRASTVTRSDDVAERSEPPAPLPSSE